MSSAAVATVNNTVDSFDPELLAQAQKALNKAKIAMMQSNDITFFTTICFSMLHKWSGAIKTAATDGKRILFNPHFFMNLSAEERLFLLVHETLHVAYMHMLRQSTKDHNKWNIATDHVINLQLLDRGFKMPKGGLADSQYKGMSAEQVYDALPPDLPPIDMPDLIQGDEPPEQVQDDIRDILIRASIQSKMAGDSPGSIPGDIEIYLNKLLNPKLPWHRILAKYINSLSKSDYSWQKPNRRFFPKHYLPSLYSNSLMDIAIATDTSGSVSDEDFNSYVSEVAGIFKMMKPKNISFIQFDTEIKSVDNVGDILDLKKLKFSGRGGTDVTPVIEWANKHKPNLLLIFTDGYFHWDSALVTPPMPVIWCIHDNEKFAAPFGKVIHFDLHND